MNEATQQPLLTICICTIECRSQFLANLLACLKPQLEGRDEIELLIDCDAGEVSIGAKRNRMLAAAKGEYICWIDDDDLVAPDYVASLVEALQSRPDCVGFNLVRKLNGFETGTAIHCLQFQAYANHMMPGGRTLYLRTPNHLNPIRIDLARQIGFPEIDFGEDGDYAKRIRPLLNTEVYIPRVMYTYLYRHEVTRKDELTHKKRTQHARLNQVPIERATGNIRAGV